LSAEWIEEFMLDTQFVQCYHLSHFSDAANDAEALWAARSTPVTHLVATICRFISTFEVRDAGGTV